MIVDLRLVHAVRRAGWLLLLGLTAVTTGDVLPTAMTDHPWQQVSRDRGLALQVERQFYSQLDGEGRFVLAVQTGHSGSALDAMKVAWALKRGDATIASGERTPSTGLVCVDFDLGALEPGRYDIAATLGEAGKVLEEKTTFFEFARVESPPTSGSVPIVMPQEIDAPSVATPLTFGIPMPKGAMIDANHARIVAPDGKVVAAQFTVRGRWGHGPAASVRWLGVDMQSAAAPPWWPKRETPAYYLEFGPNVRPAPPAVALRVEPRGTDFFVDTGAVSFVVQQKGFNLISQITLGGKTLPGASGMGPYLVDHEGAIYRAANDGDVTLTLEEAGPMRAVIRAEGWYVKDGATGQETNYSLPTDKLCRFITRIEAYAGRSAVRVLHTWIVTFDSFSVRLRDVGLALPAAGARHVRFGVEDGRPIEAAVPAGGIYLIQHRPDRFDVESGDGSAIASGVHSDGNAVISVPGSHLLGVSHRDTWQRFPKEIEVLPDQVRLHVWPAHGRMHDDIDVSAPYRYHQIWSMHQGRELDFRLPWDCLFTAMRQTDNPSTGIYKPGGTVMGGIHASAMGAAITSDLLIQFAPIEEMGRVQVAAQQFQMQHHPVADPAWLATSRALGDIHPYDPQRFPQMESVAQAALYGYRDIQDATGEYGMFLYRTWHHGYYIGDGEWNPYRLHNAGHHYEPYMPWLYFARSGDPSILAMGLANIRHLSDLGIIHYADPRYDHQEYYSRQGRLVGSMKHTNGFVTWGGDHAVFGHLTCFNGLITAYYMTGDLRLREVVVNEWQHTIVADRGNPEFGRASRIEGEGRDNNNSLGELIDLYQLTFDPRLLALMEPAIGRYTNNMMTWGLPTDNVVNFGISAKAVEQLREAVVARRTDQTASLHNALSGHSPGHLFALEAMHFNDAAAAGEALVQSNVSHLSALTEEICKQVPNAGPMCEVPDMLLYLPTIQEAAARFLGGGDTTSELTVQSLPIGSGFSRIVVREDNDAAFTIKLRGRVTSPDAAIEVVRPDGMLVMRQPIPAEADPSVIVPADGIAGQYVIFLRLTDAKDSVIVPITSLPGEVYVTPYWSQERPGRFFTREANTDDGRVSFVPHKSGARLYSGDLLAAMASTDTGEIISAAIDPKVGMWIDIRARYLSATDKRPLVLAVTPSRYFTPSEPAMTVAPGSAK